MEEKRNLTRQAEQKILYAENSSSPLKPVNNKNQLNMPHKTSAVKDLSSQLQDSLISSTSRSPNIPVTRPTKTNPFLQPRNPSPFTQQFTQQPFLQQNHQTQQTSQQVSQQQLPSMMNYSYRPNVPVTPPNPVFSNLQMPRQVSPMAKAPAVEETKSANDELQDIFG